MSLRLQIILIVCMVLALIYIVRRVATKKLEFKFGIGWSLIVIVLMIFAIWPGLLAAVSQLLGKYAGICRYSSGNLRHLLTYDGSKSSE